MQQDQKITQDKVRNLLQKYINDEPKVQQMIQKNQIAKFDIDLKKHQNYEFQINQPLQQFQSSNLSQNSNNQSNYEVHSNLSLELQNNEEKKLHNEHFQFQQKNLKNKTSNKFKSHSCQNSNSDCGSNYQLNLQDDYKIDSQNQQCLEQQQDSKYINFKEPQNRSQYHKQSSQIYGLHNKTQDQLSLLFYSKYPKQETINNNEAIFQRQITEEMDINNSSGSKKSRISYQISEDFKGSFKLEDIQSRRISKIFDQSDQFNNELFYEKIFGVENSQGSDYNYFNSNQSSNIHTPQMVSLKDIKLSKKQITRLNFKKQDNQQFFSQESSPLQKNEEKKSYKKNPNELSILIDKSEKDRQQNLFSILTTPNNGANHQKNTMSFGLQLPQPCFEKKSKKSSFQSDFQQAQKSPINEDQNCQRNQIKNQRKESYSKGKQNLFEQKIKDMRSLSEKKQQSLEYDQKKKELEQELFLKRQTIQMKDEIMREQQQKIELYSERINSIPNEQDWGSDFHNISEFIDDYQRIIYQLISKQDSNKSHIQMIKQHVQEYQYNDKLSQQKIQKLNQFLKNDIIQQNQNISELRVESEIKNIQKQQILQSIFDNIELLKQKSQNFGFNFFHSIQELFDKLLSLSKKEKFRNRLLDLNECLKYEIQELNNFLTKQEQNSKINNLKEALEQEIQLQKQINEKISHISNLLKERIIQIQEGHKEMQDQLKKTLNN
ncbi:unnamed protein product [Paramecium sonneborni]|uniref:Uncharacterized protein n=1 Tax=Paramecium sonneborni TaxID=65129 RepID=A0A8S1K2V3_9CILI|nr:unnamed protein product [Paramecium sonneborni]